MPMKRSSKVLKDLLNDGLDETLIKIRSIAEKSVEERELQNLDGILFGDILPLYEAYATNLPDPGSKLTIKDNVVIHNLREILNGACILFEFRMGRFSERFHKLFDHIMKSTLKRPYRKAKEEVKDPLDTITKIAVGAACAGAQEPILEDFDLKEVFLFQKDEFKESDLDIDAIMAEADDLMNMSRRLPTVESRDVQEMGGLGLIRMDTLASELRRKLIG
ncbi:hypothetical protein GE061_008312 [Apolygus lucorum]|uniref:Uncharacterized protein n=1 Tax=Apolygus lucorum TaxID=248454 RepID=A0A8S9WQR0_APOLU|nr:hypothetical protein GE061_008312 [Apolygus lucorum]